ncbi:Flagellar hook-basal body complex protein FliE [uncultured Gammaproteobacteria bacterium]
MVANVTNALAAYSTAATRPVSVGMAPREGDGPSFGEVLEQAAKGAIATVRKSENLSAQAVVGKADLTEVVNAVTNAEMTLQTVTSVRDKVISAYQEILRMPM